MENNWKVFANEMAVPLQDLFTLSVGICCVLYLKTIEKKWQNFLIMKNGTSIAELLRFVEWASGW